MLAGPGRRDQHVVAPRMPRAGRTFTGTGFAQPISGTPLISATSGNSDRADRIGVHERVERDAAEQPRRRIAEPIGRPRVRRLVHRQRKQQNDERDEDLREVDVQQGVTGYGRLAKNARTASATLRADDGRQLLARRAPHAGQAAERRQQRPPPPRPDAGHVVELRSQVAHRARLAMERHGEPVRLVADPLDEQQRRDRSSASAIGSSRSRVKSSSSFFAMPTATRFARPELLERRVRRRQLPLAAVDQDQIGKRAALLEQLAVAAPHDFVHRREVVVECAGPRFGAAGLGPFDRRRAWPRARVP